MERLVSAEPLEQLAGHMPRGMCRTSVAADLDLLAHHRVPLLRATWCQPIHSIRCSLIHPFVTCVGQPHIPPFP
jgi:hypothetical protein